ELLEKAELRRLAMRAGRTRGQVDGDHPQVCEARLDIAAFGVELAAGKAAPHFIGLLSAVERDTAITLLRGKGVAGLDALEDVQLRVEIDLVAFQLLQANDVGPAR